jgi:hypothetical protein
MANVLTADFDRPWVTACFSIKHTTLRSNVFICLIVTKVVTVGKAIHGH